MDKNTSVSLSKGFLDSLAGEAGYAVGSLYSAKHRLDGALRAWENVMPNGLPEYLKKLSDMMSVDLMEIEEMRAAR